MSKNVIKPPKIAGLTEEQTDIIPKKYRHPGLGDWSFSPNGYSRFLESAIRHFKEAATRCADEGLTEEYEIFRRRAQELQNQLEEYMGGHSDHG